MATNLNQGKDCEIMVNEDILLKGLKRGENCIVGKLHSDRNINKEVIRSTMMKIWNPLQPFTVQNIGPNLFIFCFDCRTDLGRVMMRRP